MGPPGVAGDDCSVPHPSNYQFPWMMVYMYIDPKPNQVRLEGCLIFKNNNTTLGRNSRLFGERSKPLYLMTGCFRHAADTEPLEGLLILRCAIYNPLEGLQFQK